MADRIPHSEMVEIMTGLSNAATRPGMAFSVFHAGICSRSFKMSDTEIISKPHQFNPKNFMEVYGDRVVAVDFIVSGDGQTVQKTFHFGKPESAPTSRGVSGDR